MLIHLHNNEVEYLIYDKNILYFIKDSLTCQTVDLFFGFLSLFSLYGLSQRSTPAVIAILAILMLFLAPEVSKNLVQWQADGSKTHQIHPGTADEMAADHNHNAHTMPSSGHHAHHAEDSDHHMMGGSSMAGDFVCGYCELLIHCPLIVWLFIPFIWLLLVSSRAPPLIIYVLFPLTDFVSSAQPRAPPVI